MTIYDAIMRWAFLVGAVMFCACTVPNPKSCADGHCSDPAFPYCDADGSIAGIPDTCIAVSCTPGEVEACQGDQALTCNATGDNFDLIQCELECDVAAGGCRSSCTLDEDCPADNPVCNEEQTCSACTADPECASRADTPFCDAGACVECVTSSQCGTATPVCSDNQCRACNLDSECDSGACGVDGSCVPEAAILYLSNASTSEDLCTKSSPCGSLGLTQFKITPSRNHIVMLDGGTYAGVGHFGNTSNPYDEVFVHGHGATLRPGQGDIPVSPIIGTSKKLHLRDVTVTGLTGNPAIQLSSSSTLERVTIVSAKALRVRAPVVARDLRISSSLGTEAILLDDTDAELTIERGQILGGEVGIRATALGAKVHLENVLIAGTSQRALELGQATGELEYSTIADAGAESPGAPCAVACNANLRVTSSIIWQESCASAVRDAAGPCTFASSIVSNAPAPGITNVDPLFVNRAGGDYHLQATSPAKDAVDTGPAVDFEGDARPQGAKFDIGADEAP